MLHFCIHSEKIVAGDAMRKAEKITEMIEERRLYWLPFLRKMSGLIAQNTRLTAWEKKAALRKQDATIAKFENELRELESEAAAISGGVN